MQRAARLAFVQLRGEPFRFRAGILRIDEDPGLDVLFPPFDGGQALLDEVDRRDASAADRLGRFVNRLNHVNPTPQDMCSVPGGCCVVKS